MFLVPVLAIVRSVYTVDFTYGLVEMAIAKLGTTRLGLVLMTWLPIGRNTVVLTI